MVKVWFNHWFSTSYGLIELMKQNKFHQIHIIASNKCMDSVIQKVCDEWYQEPLSDGEEYIQYCLEFCAEHKVDVFIPRRKMVEISRNIQRFTDIGVKVMVDDYPIMKLLNDKAAAYQYLEGCEGVHIPAYEIVNTAEGFIESYKRLKNECEQVCVKFVKDEGGLSYRRITEHAGGFKKLRCYPGTAITYDDYVSALSEAGEFDDLMLMQYLPGNEISVDCLDTEKGLIAIPRFKGAQRHEWIQFDEEILRMSQAIMDKIHLRYPCNIQFRLKDDIPYLLEVNTRMSGGMQMACLAEEINIPYIALNKLLGQKTEWSFTPKERVVSYIEVPQIIR